LGSSLISKLRRFEEHDQDDIKNVIANTDVKKERVKELAEEWLECHLIGRKKPKKFI